MDKDTTTPRGPAASATPTPPAPVTTRAQAERAARGMREAGKTYSQIAEALTARGWRSTKDGPVSLGGVASLLGVRTPRPARGGRMRAGVTDVAAAPSSSGMQIIDAVRRVLQVSSLPAEERVALALMLIDAARP